MASYRINKCELYWIVWICPNWPVSHHSPEKAGLTSRQCRSTHLQFLWVHDYYCNTWTERCLCTYTSPLVKPFEIRIVSIVWTVITCSEMAPASRLTNLARCVESRKCGVWGGWLCPNPCFRWKIWRKSIIHLGVVIFRNCPTHFHLRVSKAIRCVNGSKDCIELRATKRRSFKTLRSFIGCIAGWEGWMWG